MFAMMLRTGKGKGGHFESAHPPFSKAMKYVGAILPVAQDPGRLSTRGHCGNKQGLWPLLDLSSSRPANR